MAAKYYTHFLTSVPPVPAMPAEMAVDESCEWSGVVELLQPLRPGSSPRELRALLAQSFDVASDDIRILHWARLH